MATAPKSKPTVSKPKRTRKTLSPAEVEAKLVKMQAAMDALKVRAYAGKLDEAVKKTNVVAAYKAIKENVDKASDVAILSAIAKAAGIKSVVITKKPPVKAKPKAIK